MISERPTYQFGQTAQVPRAALRFDAPDIEIGNNGEGAKTAPVKMVARSGQPIEHWFWGKVVHDLSGMVLNKPRLPIDYCHDDEQVIGYLNKFDIASGDLVVSGAIVPYEPDDEDMAAEVLYKAQQGIPYEASINFGGDGIQIQEVADGEVTPVNGYMFEGPGIVIRQWPLRGVAICPYGADANTSTEFKDSESFTIKHVSPKGETRKDNSVMSQENKPAEAAVAAVETSNTPTAPKEAAPAPAPAVELGQSKAEAAPAVEAKPDTKLTAADYGTAFGDVGYRWFHEGKPFSQATAEFVSQLKSAHESAISKLAMDHKAAMEAKDAELTGLKDRLSAEPRGNPAAAFSGEVAKPSATEAKVKKFENSLGSKGLATFAANLVLPVGKPAELPEKK